MEGKIDESLSPWESETENDSEISANLTKGGEREKERESGGDRDGGFAFVSADDDDAKKNETGKH